MADPARSEPQIPVDLPVLPLRQNVVFPLTVQPLALHRPQALEAVNRALTGDRMLLVVMQTDETDDVSEANVKSIGTVAVVRQMARGQAGVQVLVEGLTRVRIASLTRDGDLVRAVVTPYPDATEKSIEVDAYVRRVREQVDKAVSLASGLSPDMRSLLLSIDDPLRLTYILASLLDLKPDDKQLLLEQDQLVVKLNAVSAALQREIALLELKGKIESQAQQEMSDAQRQYYLRQQLKAIQDELGESDASDTGDLRERVDKAQLPDAVRQATTRELERLERMPQASPEHQMLRTYIEWVLEIPWSITTEDRLDPREARRVLDEDHYDLDKVKERIVEYLAVRKLKGDMKGPILCFVGPPGVGKTSLGQSIARAMNRTFVRISLGGVRDEAEIRGHRRTYIGAIPGRIVQALKQAGSNNPVFMLDEIDKVTAGGFSGDPSAALLEVLDPAQNDSFTDHYLGMPFDLSEVMFIATANVLQNIPGPLLDRMEIVEFSGYIEAEKVAIAEQYLVPRQIEANGLTAEQITFAGPALLELVQRYTRESGVRQLEREVGRVARKAARKIAASEVDRMDVTAAVVRDLLGRPKLHPEEKAAVDQVGTATGMYYTPQGGDIMFVEASTMRGKGELVLTGQLGDVMKESARAAWTYARSHAAGLHIKEEMFDRDVHIHVPAGAVPKDGPSAGITMATALVSALSGREVRHDIAMTGEVTLRGRVLPIGGVKEKLLGALRAGITTIIIPKANEPDLDDLPEEARKRMDIHPVEELGEVLAIALRDVRYTEGKLLFGDENPRDVVALQSPFRH